MIIVHDVDGRAYQLNSFALREDESDFAPLKLGEQAIRFILKTEIAKIPNFKETGVLYQNVGMNWPVIGKRKMFFGWFAKLQIGCRVFQNENARTIMRWAKETQPNTL